MSNKNIRIMQLVGILMVNNAFILLAVADIDFLKIELEIENKKKEYEEMLRRGV